MNRRVEVAEIADVRRKRMLGVILCNETAEQSVCAGRILSQDLRQRETQCRPRRRSHRHEGIERRCGAGGRRTRRRARKNPRGLRRTDVEDLIADRDADAERFVLPFASEHAERQVLDRKIAGIVR